MPYYRRAWIPGGTFFFTVVTERRARILCTETARALLREAFRECRERWPFHIEAFVLLEDHLHTIWSLPSEDVDYARRWGWIKKEFSQGWVRAGGTQQDISNSRRQRRRLGVMQRGYWEHAIRDETDFARHADYIHYNPVKHGLVASVRDWPFSTFHRWVREGLYHPDWGLGENGPLKFEDIEKTAAE
jgi:putative transposase